jgi:hypothetical protein
MKRSLYTPPGLYEYRAGKPIAEGLHETALALFSKHGAERGGFSTEPGSLVDMISFAMAIVLARVARADQHVDGERFADGAYYLLDDFEEEYDVTPGGDDTLVDRREALARAKRAARGCTRQELEQQLRELLGDKNGGLHVATPDEVAVWPAELGDQPQLLQDAERDRKLIRITPVIIDGLGAPQTVAYEAIDPKILPDEDHSLTVGEPLVVEPEILHRAEVVTIATLGLDGDTPTFTATFDNPHEPGCWAARLPFPAWTSTQRHVIVGLVASAISDPILRNQLHVMLGKVLPIVTTWDICGLSGSAQVGPWTIGGDPALGVIGRNPLGIITMSAT